MRYLILFLLLFATFPAMGQKIFELKNASKYFDIKINVAECDNDSCRGAASFGFYKKGGATPYQTVELGETYIQLQADGQPEINTTLLYDTQSVLNIDDYNFDGMEDVAICNGTNGSYGGPSYNIYLSSKAAKKFVYNKALTELGSHLGMFRVDKKNKTLETFDKSGCCWHITERYSVVNNRPVKIFEEVEDASLANEERVRITTKKLIRGKWKTTVRSVKREE